MGIIPVAGQKLDFKFPWHDCCQPIAQDYLAVERAAVECAYAGASSIWIICNDDQQPLIRHRLGDYLGDPTSLRRSKFVISQEAEIKYCPIFYVPIHHRDRDKRDCLSWSVLHGATIANKVTNLVSKWALPDRFYISFPYGVYLPNLLQSQRQRILKSRQFYVTFEGKTVKDDEYLGFSLTQEDIPKLAKYVRKKGTGRFLPNQSPEDLIDGRFPSKKYPIGERNSARFFSLSDVFNQETMNEGELLEIEEYSNIGSWEGLRKYWASDLSSKIIRPSKKLIQYHELGPTTGIFE